MSNIREASSSSQAHGRAGAPGQDPRVAYVKKLTLSDAITSKQVKLPKAAAENFLPILNDKETCSVVAVDEEERSWTFSCTRYNCQYALSRIGPFAQAHNLAPDIFLIFYWDDDTTLRVACRWELPCVLDNGLTIQLPLQSNTGRPAYGRARQQQQQYGDSVPSTRSSGLPMPRLVRMPDGAPFHGAPASMPTTGPVYGVCDQLTPIDGHARRTAVRQAAASAAEASAGVWRRGTQPLSYEDDGGGQEEGEGQRVRQAMSHLSESAGHLADPMAWHAQQAQVMQDQQYRLQHFQQSLAGQRHHQHPGFSPRTMPGFQGMMPLPYGPGALPAALFSQMYGHPGLAGFGSTMPEWMAFGGWPMPPVQPRQSLEQPMSPRGTKRSRQHVEASTPASPTVAMAAPPAASCLASEPTSAAPICKLEGDGGVPALSGSIGATRPALRLLSMNTLADGAGLKRAGHGHGDKDRPDFDSPKRRRKIMAGAAEGEGKENLPTSADMEAGAHAGGRYQPHKEGCSAADGGSTVNMPAWMAAATVTPPHCIPEAGVQRLALGAAPLSVPAGVPASSALAVPECEGLNTGANTPAFVLAPAMRLAGFSDPRAAPFAYPSTSKPSSYGAGTEQQGERRLREGVAVWTDLPEGSSAPVASRESAGQAMDNRQVKACDVQQQKHADLQHAGADGKEACRGAMQQGGDDSCEAAAEALTLLASGSRPTASEGTSGRPVRAPIAADYQGKEDSVAGMGSQRGGAMPSNSTGVSVRSGDEAVDGGSGPPPVARPSAFRPVRMPAIGQQQQMLQSMWPLLPQDVRNRVSPGLPGGYYDPVQMFRGGRGWQPGTSQGLDAPGASSRASFAGADEQLLGGRGHIQVGPAHGFASPCRQAVAPPPMMPMLPQHMHGFFLAWHHMQQMQQMHHLAHLLPNPAGTAHALGYSGHGRSQGSVASALDVAQQQVAQAQAVKDSEAQAQAPEP